MPHDNTSLPERVYIDSQRVADALKRGARGVTTVTIIDPDRWGDSVIGLTTSYTRTNLVDKALEAERAQCKATVEHTAELLRDAMKREAEKDAEVKRLREALEHVKKHQEIVSPTGFRLSSTWTIAARALTPSPAPAKKEGE